MSSLLRTLLIVCLLTPLSACSLIDRWVYKIDIPQGSFIDNERLEQLRIGMSKPQVEFLLGSPMMTDSFDSSRWYYLYRLQDGDTGVIDQSDLTLVFGADGRLSGAETDLELSASFNQPYAN